MAGTAAALASKPSGLRWLLRYVRPCSYLCSSPPSLQRYTNVRPELQDSEISRPPPPAAAAVTIEAARQVVHVDVEGKESQDHGLPKESGNQDKHLEQQNDQQKGQEVPQPPPVPPAGSHRGSAAAAMPVESRAGDTVRETIGATEDQNKKTK